MTDLGRLGLLLALFLVLTLATLTPAFSVQRIYGAARNGDRGELGRLAALWAPLVLVFMAIILSGWITDLR